MRTGFCVLFFAAATVASAAAPITFSETIAPILYQNCVTCHRPGEAAPFSLLTYDDARKRGALIAAVTKSRYMPPWHAEHGYGEFTDERRLTDAQIAAIGDWVAQGMPQGDPAKTPKPPQFTSGWQLGQPDLVLEMPAGYQVPSGGPDIYRNFVIPIPLAEDKWVRAVEFRPSARQVVHHALFGYVRAGALANVDGKDGQPGFSGMSGLTFGAPGMEPSGNLGGWAVGGIPAFLPEGLALRLAKGTDLVLAMHFHPTGKPETERSTIGIYFAKAAPERTLYGDTIPALFGIGAGIDIPAGEKNYTIRDSTTLPADVRVYRAYAHAHYLGKEMKATATLPDGTTRPLLWITDWNFNWQEQYTYKQPLMLPKGTRIDVSIRYDNSADNPRNPSNPPKRVLWGEESFDEMGAMGFLMVAIQKEAEPALLAALETSSRAAVTAGLLNGSVRRFMEEQQRSQAASSPTSRLQQITLFDRQGQIVRTIGDPGLYTQPALSPDGSRIAVIKNDLETRSTDLWVFDAVTGKGARVASDQSSKSAPVWSPDGTEIAYVASAGGRSAIYRTRSNGSGTPELMYQPPPPQTPVLTDWSGGLICFWAGPVTYALPVNGDRKPVELFHESYNVRGVRFSPDGRFLAYNSDESGKFQTYVGAFRSSPIGATKGPQVSRDPAAGGNFWRQDGKELYFLSLPPRQGVMAVEIDSSGVAGAPRALFQVPSPIGAPAQLSSVATPDGARFVFLQQVTTR